MAVNLTKPKIDVNPHIREITPIHICDEIYPNNAPVAIANETVILDYSESIAKYLKSGLITAAQISNKYHNNDKNTCPDLEGFFGKENTIIANISVENNHVVYLNRSSLISKTYTAICSDFLDNIHALLTYLERLDATFDGLCDFLDTKWTTYKKSDFYNLFCDFLSDIKTNNVTKIENILTGKQQKCYDSLLNGTKGYKSVCSSIFFDEINTRLYHALYEVLKRETEIEINPLFLFLCQNFYAKPKTEYKTYDDYRELRNQRSSLIAYGMMINGTMIKAKPQLPKLFRWIDDNANDLCGYTSAAPILSGTMMSTIGLLCNMSECLSDATPNIATLAKLNIPVMIGLCCISLGVFCLTSIFLVQCMNAVRMKNRETTFLYGGLQCFLLEHPTLPYTISQQIATKIPRKIQKQLPFVKHLPLK